MDVPQDVREIEQIKQLKARYIRFGDTQNWSELAQLLTEDFEAVFDIAPRFSKDQPTRVADVVMFIYRDEVYNNDTPARGEAEVIVAKHRNGPIGTDKLAFLGQFTKFADLART